MNLRLFAAAGVILAGAAGLQTIKAGSGLAALLGAPAQAAGTAAVEASPEDAAPQQTAEPTPLPAPEVAEGAQSFPERIGASADEYAILISLQERRRELEQWESDIDTRAQLVATAEAQVQTRLAELHAVREEIRGLLGQLDEQEEARIAALVSTYEKMKSDDAARILAGLEDDTALLVLSRMKAANLGAILGDMQTGDAARLTQMLAARADTAELVGELEEDAGAQTAAAGET